jgi:hypothetical protein
VNEYQRGLEEMARELRAKQYAHQHRRTRDDSHVNPHPPTSPIHQPAVAAMSQSQGATRRPSSARPISPRRAVHRAPSKLTARGVPASASARVPPPLIVPSANPTPRSMPEALSPRGPISPRGHSRGSSTLPNMISVPIEWFEDMQQKVASLAAVAPSDQATKAAELQRMKYAMLITKLEEMNRLHREVVSRSKHGVRQA